MPFSISKETVPGFHHRWLAVGTTPVQLTLDRSLLAKKGILIRAINDELLGNAEGTDYTGVIYVGGTPLVKAITAPPDADDMELGGVPIVAGDTFIFPSPEPWRVWLVSNLENQLVSWAII